jgi:AAA domain
MAFRKAAAKQAALKFGIYGPPGSGKTFTTLLAAEGIARAIGKRVAFVDTEHGTDFYSKEVSSRATHPEAFDFDALYTRSLTEVLKEVKGLSPDQYGVVVIDSISHLWDAAKAAYQGKTTKIGTIPMQAWGSIKKPYKELVAWLLNSTMHVFILGRQSQDYQDDEDTGELKNVGVKMRAEGETAYEPHILIRMEAVKPKKGRGVSVPTAFVEKDRTGVLQGKSIQYPGFDSLVAPVMSLLGGDQAVIPTEEEVGLQDAEALAQAEAEKNERSLQTLDMFRRKFLTAESSKEVDDISKAITASIKRGMVASHVDALRQQYLEASRRVKGMHDGQLQGEHYE